MSDAPAGYSPNQSVGVGLGMSDQLAVIVWPRRTAGGLDHWGRYTDRFGCVDGRWVFTQRSVRVDGATPGGWAALRGHAADAQGVGEAPGRHDVP